AAQQIARAHHCTWGFYLQADEVVHEDALPPIAAAMQHSAAHAEGKALQVRNPHFALQYQTVEPRMYHNASPLMRLDDSSHIVGDACGPAIRDYSGPSGNRDGYLDKNFLGRHVQWARDPHKKINRGKAARIFHYGWVKTRAQLDEKFQMVEKLWWGTLDKA